MRSPSGVRRWLVAAATGQHIIQSAKCVFCCTIHILLKRYQFRIIYVYSRASSRPTRKACINASWSTYGESKKRKLNENREKFRKFDEIGVKFMKFVQIRGNCNMHHWLKGWMDNGHSCLYYTVYTFCSHLLHRLQWFLTPALSLVAMGTNEQSILSSVSRNMRYTPFSVSPSDAMSSFTRWFNKE